MSNSILHPKFEGTLVLISGLHGLGKTTLAATMENPALTGMIDFDLKGRALATEIGMAFYTSPEQVSNPDDYDVKTLAEWFFKTLTKLPDGLTHLIIDNATWAEAGLGYRVLQNPVKYGVNAKNAQAGVYGGVNPGITVLWSNIFGYLQNKGVKVVTVINHMSQPWINGAPAPNKFNVKGNKVFNQLASLAVILTPANPARGGKPPIPSGLVIKEALSVNRFEGGEFLTVKVIPARIPVCNWRSINGYFNTPANFATPAPGEEWTRAEVDSYSEWLSPEQVQWVMKVGSYSEEDTEPTPIVKTVVEQPKPATPPARCEICGQQLPTHAPGCNKGKSEGAVINSPQTAIDEAHRQLGQNYYSAPAHAFNSLKKELGAQWTWPATRPLNEAGWKEAVEFLVYHAKAQLGAKQAEGTTTEEVAF